MSRFSEKGYFVKENAPVYLTEDMSKTVKWFEEIMGWYGNVVEKDELGNGLYGVVFDILPEIEITHLAPFTGFQLFKGKPEPRAISFMQVKNIEKMYSYIISKRLESNYESRNTAVGRKDLRRYDDRRLRHKRI